MPAPISCACFDDPGAANMGVWWRIGGGAFLAMNAMVMSLAVNGSEVTSEEKRALELGILLVSGAVFVLLGGDFVSGVAREFRRKRISLELLFLLGLSASLGASILSMRKGLTGSYADVAALLLVIYSLGREVGRYGQRKVIKALEDLAAVRQFARIVTNSGSTVQASAYDVIIGDRIRVLPGEPIPVDGQVLRGQAFVHEAGMTGESFASLRKPGDLVKAGCFPLDGSLDLEATAGGASELYRLRDAALEGLVRPGARQVLADRVLRYFIPAVMILAGAAYFLHGSTDVAIFHALSVIVVACPCALGFATPLAVWSGMARLRELGFLVRSGDALERLGEVDVVIFDKTGTLTLPDQYSVSWTLTSEWDGHAPMLRALLKETELASGHPLARAMSPLWLGCALLEGMEAEEVRILPGVGVEATIHHISSGTSYFVFVGGRESSGAERRIELQVDGRLAATIQLAEVLTESLSELVTELETSNTQIYLSTGDDSLRADRIPISRRMSRQGPLEKKQFVESITATGRRVLFVGDGLNDVAAMAWSHASLAASQSNPAVRESADFLALGANWNQFPKALKIARRTVRRISSNITLSLIYNASGMTLATAGILHPVTAAILMTASSLLVILLSLQLLEQSGE